MFNPFAPGNFVEKRVLKLVERLFLALSCYKELKLTIKPFTGRKLGGLLIQIQNISFRFSFLIFFFCWAFSRLHFGGKSF